MANSSTTTYQEQKAREIALLTREEDTSKYFQFIFLPLVMLIVLIFMVRRSPHY